MKGEWMMVGHGNVESRLEELRRQLRALDTKIQHLTTAIEQGGAGLPSIIALLAARQPNATRCARRPLTDNAPLRGAVEPNRHGRESVRSRRRLDTRPHPPVAT
jgi:hypothetical protein